MAGYDIIFKQKNGIGFIYIKLFNYSPKGI